MPTLEPMKDQQNSSTGKKEKVDKSIFKSKLPALKVLPLLVSTSWKKAKVAPLTKATTVLIAIKDSKISLFIPDHL